MESGSSCRVGGDTIRVSGKIYSIDSLIEGASSNAVTPSGLERVFSAMLFVVLLVAINRLGFRVGGVVSGVVALCVHEFGHFIGMKTVGWPGVTLQLGLLGPIASGVEGVSAGRKALVSLFGPAVGFAVAACFTLSHHYFGGEFWMSGVETLVFISVLNLLPMKPFDGYAILEHLVFLKHPRLQMLYLAICGIVLVALFGLVVAKDGHPVFAILLGCGYTPMFMSVKKIDNMADMVVRLRKNAVADFEAGQYSPNTIKKMEYSLAMFEFVGESDLAGFLRELWDKAWEQQASRYEAFNVLVMYSMMILACVGSPMIKRMVIGVAGLMGV